MAEKYRKDESREGRDEARRKKPNYRLYTILGTVAVLLMVAWYVWGPKPPNPAEGKIALDFMVEGSAGEQFLYDRIISDFNASQDDIYVFAGTVPSSGYEQKLLIMIGARDAPDVFSLRFDRIPIYAENGALVPLDGFLESSSLSKADLGDRLAKGISNEQIVGLPHPGRPEIFSISSLSANPEAAWAFLEFVMQKLQTDWPEEMTIPDDARRTNPQMPMMPGF